MAFNPSEHFIQLPKRKKDPKTGQWTNILTDYLEVKWRVVWFREDNPNWGIETDIVSISEQQAIFKCTIKDESGRVVSIGHGSETPKDFNDYIEKAETKSIGRALAYLGYGTQFAPELDENERIVDSSVERKQNESKKEHIDQLITSGQKKEMGVITKKKNISSKDMSEIILNRYQKNHSNELTKQEASDLIEFLNTL